MLRGSLLVQSVAPLSYPESSRRYAQGKWSTHVQPLYCNIPAVNAQIAFIAIYIFYIFFASTWGPSAWVIIGEIFPLPIRPRGVALSTGCGTPSSPSSHPTWSTRTRATSARPSSSFGYILCSPSPLP
ncbi:hypothetical protein V8E55_002673 [Tylopilus felleus]